MKRGLLAILAVFSLALASGVSAAPANAASYVIVTPSNTQGWTSAEPAATTRDGGTVAFVADPNPPGWPRRGALELTTPLLPLTAKAQYMHAAAVPLANVNELSYWTKQVSATFPEGDPSYQLQVCLNGATASPPSCSGFTTLVYEPYWNGVVTSGGWQYWDVDQGQFWSSRTVVCTGGGTTLVPPGVEAGGGGPPLYRLAVVKAMCPNAVAIAFGVNIGTNNPGYVVRTDLVDFNGTIYNFEPDPVRCRDSHGDGSFDNDRGEHGKFSFKHHHCDGDNHDDDRFDSADRGDGKDFHSSSVSSTVIDDNAHTITMTGIGSSTGGLPVSFVLVALQSTATTPGWVSMTFGDGYTTAGDLLAGEIILDQ